MAEKCIRKQVIVNADDFGYSEERNRGIVESFVSGVVSSVSFLVNGSSVTEAIALAEENRIPMGLHLNLTEGLPLTKACSTLTDERGFLRGKMGFREALNNGRINEAEIEMEIVAQMEWFQKHVGSLPTHVDGHQHVHVLPQVHRLFSKVLQRFGVLSTRLPVELGLESCPWIAGTRRAFYTSVIDCADESRQILSAVRIRYPGTFIGLSTMGRDMTLGRIKQAFGRVFSSQRGDSDHQHLPKNSKTHQRTAGMNDEVQVCEWMVHPGYRTKVGHGGCGQGPDDFACSDDRENELKIITSQSLKEFFEKECIELISFRDFSAAG